MPKTSTLERVVRCRTFKALAAAPANLSHLHSGSAISRADATKAIILHHEAYYGTLQCALYRLNYWLDAEFSQRYSRGSRVLFALLDP